MNPQKGALDAFGTTRAVGAMARVGEGGGLSRPCRP